MSKGNIGAKATVDLASRVAALEGRIATLEQASRKFTRKKHDYTDKERAAIRARLLAGQEAARKGREAGTTAQPVNTKTEQTKKAIKDVRPRKRSTTVGTAK
jgi:hypothetical protein